MNAGFRIGRIAGVELRIDWSLLIIFFILSFTLAAGLFPRWHPDWNKALAWSSGVIAALLFFCSVLIHELSHAMVGRMHGIEVKRITLFVFGGAAEIDTEPQNWHGEFQTAIIGPVVSLIIGGLCIAFTGMVVNPMDIDPDHLKESLAALGVLPTLLLWLGQINIVLGLFNLLPAFPLDGGRMLRAVLWGATGNLRRATRWAATLGQAFAWLLIALGVAMVLGVQVPLFGKGFAGGFWLGLIGWFLNNAAIISYGKTLIRESLQDVPVARLMQTRFLSVAPDLPVDRLVEDFVVHSDQRGFPVIADGRLKGMVSLQHIRKLERSRWGAMTVADVMTPFSASLELNPRDDALSAITLLAKAGVNQLPVTENGQMCGLLRREEVLKWVSLYEDVDVHPAAMVGR